MNQELDLKQEPKKEPIKELIVKEFKEGLKEVVKEFLQKTGNEANKIVGYDYNKEGRLNQAVENAFFTLTNYNVGELSKIKEVIGEHSDATRYHRSGGLHEQVRAYVSSYKTSAATAQIYTKSFIEDVRVMFRSFQMMLQMVGMSGTHREKDARMRGTVAYLEGLLTKLSNVEVEYIFSQHRWVNIFESEYPIRDMVSKVNSLKNENKALKERLKKDGATDEELQEFEHPFF